MTGDLQSFALGLIAFLIGLLMPFTINVVGSLPLAELILIGILGFIILQVCLQRQPPGGLLRTPIFWLLLSAQVVAFASYILSDLYRESSTRDMIRGWSRMVFLGIDIVSLAWLLGASRAAFSALVLGGVFGGIAAVQVYGVELGDPWKFGYAGPVTMLVFLLAPRLGVWLGTLTVGALGVLHLALDFRSMGALCLFATALLALQIIPRRGRVLLFVPAIVAGFAVVWWFYQGRDNGQRGGRSDVERAAMITAAWEGFAESPLIGQGSWFSKSRVMDNFLTLRYEGAQLAGVGGYSRTELEENLTIHSQLLVTLAEGGLFGGAFFICYGALLLLALVYCAVWRVPDLRRPVYIILLLLALWNLLASPFSGSHRVIVAMNCGVILLLWKEWRETFAAPEFDFADATPRVATAPPQILSYD